MCLSKKLEEDDARWHHLPSDLLRLILCRLPAIDYLQFRSVCKSWRSVATDGSVAPAPQGFPWIGRRLEWFDFSESGNRRRPITIRFPEEFDRWRCRGTSHGWMIMASYTKQMVTLLNPISKAQIRLPPDLFRFDPTIGTKWKDRFMDNWAMKLSSSPSSGDCLAIAWGSGKSISICRIEGDEGWKELEVFTCMSGDILLHKQLLFKLGSFSRIWNSLQPRVTKLTAIPAPIGPQGENYEYLVESSGDLLKVVLVSPRNSKTTFQCCVFKLCFSDDGSWLKKWTEINSLGDRTLFVGSSKRSESISVSGGLGPRPNSVYYICPNANCVICFSLEDGSQKRIPFQGSLKDRKGIEWFMPQSL